MIAVAQTVAPPRRDHVAALAHARRRTLVDSAAIMQAGDTLNEIFLRSQLRSRHRALRRVHHVVCDRPICSTRAVIARFSS